MATLRLRTNSPSKEPWQPYMSPVSPTTSDAAGRFESSTSLSDRCRKLAYRLGGSAVHDDEHFCEQPTTPKEEGSPNSKSRRLSLPDGRSSPPRGFHNGSSYLAPPSPLSPRSHPPTSPESTHILNEILEEGEGANEATPKAEAGPRGAYTPAPPYLGFSALGEGSGPVQWGPEVKQTGALGLTYEASAPASGYSSSLAETQSDLSEEDADNDAAAVIEERVAEIQNQLQDGATWQAVDIWLVEGELLVGPNQQSLVPSRTFSTTWVEPLLQIFSASVVQIGTAHRRRSSVYSHIKPSTPFQLVIRLRTPASMTFPYVVDALQPLQDVSLLTRYCPNARATTPGLVTVVSSEADGAEMVPLEDLNAIQGERFVYRDASLAALERSAEAKQGEQLVLDPQVTPVAAGELLPTTGWDGQSNLTMEQRARIERQIAQAHAAGLKVRYEALPQFPVHVRENIRTTLQGLGVDYL